MGRSTCRRSPRERLSAVLDLLGEDHWRITVYPGELELRPPVRLPRPLGAATCPISPELSNLFNEALACVDLASSHSTRKELQTNRLDERVPRVMIRLIGPGGAGKTSVGLALARRLGIAFVDLDGQFTTRIGDISAYLRRHGYQTYANRNIQVYLDVLRSLSEETVLALSSGFMMYRDDTHPAYRGIYREVGASRSTVALLPSFDYETCVTETVRRQLTPPFSRSPEKEERVIRARFGVYWGLPTKKFETSRPIDAVVDDLVTHLLPSTR